MFDEKTINTEVLERSISRIIHAFDAPDEIEAGVIKIIRNFYPRDYSDLFPAINTSIALMINYPSDACTWIELHQYCLDRADEPLFVSRIDDLMRSIPMMLKKHALLVKLFNNIYLDDWYNIRDEKYYFENSSFTLINYLNDKNWFINEDPGLNPDLSDVYFDMPQTSLYIIYFIANEFSEIAEQVSPSSILNKQRYKDDIKCLISSLEYIIKAPVDIFASGDESALYQLGENLIDTYVDCESEQPGDVKTIIRRTTELMFGLYTHDEVTSVKHRTIGTPIKEVTNSKSKKTSSLNTNEINNQVIHHSLINFPNLYARKAKLLRNNRKPDVLRFDEDDPDNPDIGSVPDNIESDEQDLNIGIDTPTKPTDKEEDNEGADSTKILEAIDNDENDNYKSKAKGSRPGSKYAHSQSDARVISITVIFGFLEYLRNKNPLYFAYAYLCMVTDLSPARVSTLNKTNNLTDEFSETVYLKGEFIYYRLINAAKDFDRFSWNDAHIPDGMIIKLPNEILQIIYSNPSTEPFLSFDTLVTSLSYNFESVDITPTPHRLGFLLKNVLTKHGISMFEAYAASGDFGYSFRAASRYICMSLDIFNNRFQNAIIDFRKHFEKEMQLDLGYILPSAFSDIKINKSFGSSLAFKLSDFKPLICSFIETFNSIKKDKNSFKRDRMITKYNFMNNYLYLIYQLLTAMRPFGDETYISQTNTTFGIFAKQKDSRIYKENSLIPVPDILKDQIDYITHTHDNIINYLHARGYTCTTKHINTSKPNLIILNTNKKHYKYLEITGATFEKSLSEYDFIKLLPDGKYISNMFRHSMYSYLFNNINSPFLNDFTQHNSYGIELFSFWSTLDINDIHNWNYKLNRLAQNLGFLCLR